jgi:GLPGLI family protein
MIRMKNVLLAAALLVPFLAWSQATEGSITYAEEVKIRIDLPEEDRPMRAQMPNSHTVQWVLNFKGETSLFREPENDEAAETTHEAENEGATIRMVMTRPELRIFKNLEEDRKVESREFMGRKFLIRGELKPLPWKISGERREILGYDCQKAVLQDTSRQVEAWFATALPISNGPLEFGQLPGMILALHMENGDRVITATKVELKPLPKDAIEEPTKGKEVTQEEFNRIRDEKLKEMGAQGGRQRIIIRN